MSNMVYSMEANGVVTVRITMEQIYGDGCLNAKSGSRDFRVNVS